MSRSYAKIIDHPNLIRDMSTQAILNTDLSVVRKHQRRMIDMEKEQARDNEISTLKRELLELKEMLRAFTKK